MASTKDISKLWGVSPDTVTKLCRSGLVPSAEMISGKWDIPLDAPKPPCTAYMANKYLRAVRLLNEGAPVSFSLFGKKEPQLVDSFEYLKEAGFLTDFRWQNDASGGIDFAASLKDVKLTTAGEELASEKEGQGDKERAFDASLAAKLGGTKIPAEVNASVKYSSKKK